MRRKKMILIPRIRGILYYAIILMIIKTMCSISTILPYSDLLDTIISLGAAVLFAIYILKQRYTPKTLIVYVLIATLALYSSVKAGNHSLLITVMTCLAIRKENMKVTLNFIYKYELLFFLIHTILALLGSAIWRLNITDLNATGISYNFGMSHHNTFSAVLFNLILLWIYLNFEKIKIQNVVCILIIEIIAYFFTRTKTSLLEIVILSLILVAVKKSKGKELKWLAIISVPAFFTMTMWLVFLYIKGNPIAIAADKLITSRFRLGAYAIEQYGLSIFGKPVEYAIQWNAKYGLNKFTFDNIYTYLAVSQGIAWLLVISILFMLLAKKNDKKTNYMIFAWAMYGVPEVYGLNIYIFFPMILVTSLLKSKKVFHKK